MRHYSVWSVISIFAVLAGVSTATAAPKKPVRAQRPPGLYATLNTTAGPIVIKLYEKEAPNTVKNFVGLASGTKPFTDPKTGKQVKRPFYNGIIFHRVIKGFMIQGGDPLGTGSGGPGYQFEDELPTTLDYTPGTVAMANAGPNTNGSQFFIMHGDYSGRLPKNYSIFGKVVAQSAGTVVVQSGGKSRESIQTPVDTRLPVVRREVPAAGGKSRVLIQTPKGFVERRPYSTMETVKSVNSMETVNKIATAETTMGGDGAMSKPLKTVRILSVKIERVGPAGKAAKK